MNVLRHVLIALFMLASFSAAAAPEFSGMPQFSDYSLRAMTGPEAEPPIRELARENGVAPCPGFAAGLDAAQRVMDAATLQAPIHMLQ